MLKEEDPLSTDKHKKESVSDNVIDFGNISEDSDSQENNMKVEVDECMGFQVM